MNLKKSFLRRWELALLIALCAALFSGVWARREQKELADKLIRLHVIAVSDEEQEQELKLAVRDRVLEIVSPLIEDAGGRASAGEKISRILPQLESAAEQLAAERGQDCEAAARLEVESYPTRHYENFSLPAGEYLSLKLVLGRGEGKNWWCVVFPPLCLDAAQVETGAVGGLDEKDVALICEDGGGYTVKFKLLELWGGLAARFSK